MLLKCEADLPPQCPPSDAGLGGVDPVYRFIEGDHLQEIDFLNHKERKMKYPSDKTCEALAISFYTTLEAANITAKKFPRLKDKKILCGKITPSCGLHNTRNNHINLWLAHNANILETFLEKEDEND